MDPYKRKKINKILIIVAIVLVVITAIVAIVLASLNKKEEIIYEDNISNKNYFMEIIIDLGEKEIVRDGKETTLNDEFQTKEGELTEEQETLIFSSSQEAITFFQDSTFEIKVMENKLYITNKFQTKKILVQADELKKDFGAEEITELQQGLYILKYDTQKKTRAAYEYFSSAQWVTDIELDKISIIDIINDESQTVYGSTEETKVTEKTYGITAMGLDKYKKIIKDNGNPAGITIATIGYGACIDNDYFKGRLSEDYYNFIDNSKEIHETIPQGSRVLEVLKEATTDNVKLMPLVVINDENYTTTASIVEAISYATKKSDVICYEFTNEESDMINYVLNNAFKENVPVCCVAPKTETENTNEEKNNTDINIENKGAYPANNATTIAVSSIDKSSKETNYSGSGDYLDFVAYSTDVEEIFDTSSSVSRWSGAQYSNAHIVSAIALIKTYNKDYTILEVYNVLRNYCKDLGDKGKDDTYGYGCPDFSKIKISDIDKKPAELQEVAYDNEKWEKSKEIKILANDNIRIYGWAITNSTASPKEWNKIENLSAELNVTSKIEKNGTYYVWVTDSAGNASYMNIEISKIDTTAPKIQYTIDETKKESEKYISINVTATDDGSGLHEKAYSWDNQNWGSDSNTLKVTENGRYTIYVRDALENVSKKEIVIKTFEEEGIATIGEGDIIKSIVVSADWDGETNNAVRITFSDNLDIELWRITELAEIPAEFINDNVEDDVENNESDSNTNNSSTNSTTSNYDSGIQGYTNITVTVSLKVNTQYYAWIKDIDGNIVSQGFKISKAEI